MRVGKLRHRLVIQTYTDAVNAYGEPSRTWTTFATVFADIRPVSGREYLASDKVQAEVSTVIVIRYLDGLLPKMRCTNAGRTFEIVAALPDRTNATLQQLMCNEVV